MASRPEAARRRRRVLPDRARVVRAAYRLGWRHGGRLPEPVVRALSLVAARVVVARDGVHVARLRENLTVLSGRPADAALLRAGIASYLRTFWEVLALPRWSPQQVLDRVDLVNGPVVHEAFATTGAVIALPHSGNWDLAGAWACLSGMPVTSVAEQLGAAEFAAFLAFREGLGMEILSHRAPGLVDTLVEHVHRRRLVCLMADRNFSGRGVEVDLAGRRVTMPAGPAEVARRSGAALIPTVAHYGGRPLRRGAQMRLVLGPVVPAQPGDDGLVAMVQACADFFTAVLSDHPEDWHVLQPFFDVPARRPTAVA
ncbi:phosphatidylinositol mannoside acyltransferase [Microlunatus flavus]|uniref:KDO2-lipid IV(A) lauroyltransferase n=1 Tax=Microlunatus flavus TaxID=1036181 RepID=A0A1H9G8S1_9ACTN|nr:phosphatidylinositol mannoside acyltransferase [Microlunatus flavus]SEQ46506.1 KDO2-lipid IV(A) lauroyltransferase [Microlunatus flavus]